MRSSKTKIIGIVIVNWNNEDVLKDCLKSIEQAGYLENVVVVDNGSKEISNIKNQRSKIRIIENGENLGYAGGNNAGIKYLLDDSSRQARTIKSLKLRYILILNPDTEVDKDTISILLDFMEKNKEVGIGGPKILGMDKKIWSLGGVLDKKRFSAGLIGLGEKNFPTNSKNINYAVDYIPGTAMIVRREVFEKCGLFNPDYFIYYEDVELSHRVLENGFKLAIVPDATIIHKESSSFGKKSAIQDYYMARNHFLFVERNAPFEIKLRELIRLPKTLFEHWQKKEIWAIMGIRDYLFRRFGKYDDRS